MSENESALHEITRNAKIRISFYSLLLIVIASLLLISLSFLEEKLGIPGPGEPWWYTPPLRFIETLMGAGALGLLFEWLLRREVISEVVERLKLLFAIDKSFAGRLSTSNRKELVLNTLKAHLEDDSLAQAIYANLIDRYFAVKNTLTRYNLSAVISLYDLDEDIQIACDGKQPVITLEKQHYYGIDVTMEYRAMFSAEKSLVGVILTEEPKELNSWFNKSQAVFRHYFLLPEQKRKQLISMLTDGKDCPVALLDKFFQLTIAIGKKETKIPIESFKLKSDSRESIEIFLNQEALHRAQTQLAEDEIKHTEGIQHRIVLRTCIPKEARLYPYLIRDPHKDPNFQFLYSAASSVTRVIPLVNFSGDAATAVRANHYDKEKYAEVTTHFGDDVWVFPNSSVVFRWN